MNKDNPHASSHLQALLDLKARGFEHKPLGEVIKELQDNRAMSDSLMELWNKRLYSDDSIKWGQVTKCDGLMALSSQAYQILGLLGLYASQQGFIKIKYETISSITKISVRKISDAMNELKDSGCIRPIVKYAGQQTPIYEINQQVINIGRKNNHFSRKGIAPKDYVLDKPLRNDDGFDYRIIQHRRIDNQLDDTKLIYTELTVDLTKKEFSDLTKESENPNNN